MVKRENIPQSHMNAYRRSSLDPSPNVLILNELTAHGAAAVVGKLIKDKLDFDTKVLELAAIRNKILRDIIKKKMGTFD